MCEKIARLVGMQNSPSQQDELNSIHNNQQKQIYITKLVKQAGVNLIHLPHDNKNKLTLNFQKMLANLNSILLSQYSQKSNLQLTTNEMVQIQETDEIFGSH